VNMSKTPKTMPVPNPKLLNRPLHKRILREAWAFNTPLDQLPGQQHGARTEYTVTGRKGGSWTDVDSSRFNFIDNGGDILIVAHTDSVVGRTWLKADKHVIASPALDNRIGVWLALCELPRHGIKADVLLTEGEETGQSTAWYFRTTKKYNWIAEFDRMGFDCALYQFSSRETQDMAASAGYTPVRGSFTDICSLEHLGVKAFNFGVCYRDYHSDRAHIFTAELEVAIEMFLYFHEMYAGMVLPHNPAPKGGGKWNAGISSRGWNAWEDWDDYKPFHGSTKGGANWVPANTADEVTYYQGQNDEGYLDDGQGFTPSTWKDIEVYRNGQAYSLEEVSKHGEKAKPKGKATWGKWDTYRDTVGTSAELTTTIECDVCLREFHPSQLTWHGREESFLCEDCETYIHGQQKQALALNAKLITDDAACDFCGTSAEKTMDCRVNGSKITICGTCVHDLISTGHHVEQSN
jgi:hypothetical protein